MRKGAGAEQGPGRGGGSGWNHYYLSLRSSSENDHLLLGPRHHRQHHLLDNHHKHHQGPWLCKPQGPSKGFPTDSSEDCVVPPSSKMQGTRYLCVLYLATAGQQGARLGSDEEEVVLLIYVIIDVAANKVSLAH